MASKFGESEFWKRKMRTFFKRKDVDQDGLFTRKDYEIMADRYEEMTKGQKGCDPARTRTLLLQLWQETFEEMSKKHPITFEYLCEGFKEKGKEGLSNNVRKLYSELFDAIDTNQDDRIQVEEFIMFYKISGIEDRQAAIDSFKAVDTNGDGVLSREEFVHAGVEFFTSDDLSLPSRLLYGPLVD